MKAGLTGPQLNNHPTQYRSILRSNYWNTTKITYQTVAHEHKITTTSELLSVTMHTRFSRR